MSESENKPVVELKDPATADIVVKGLESDDVTVKPSKIRVLSDTFYMTAEALAKEPQGFDVNGAVRQVKDSEGNWFTLSAGSKIEPHRYVFDFQWAVPVDFSPEAIAEVNAWLTDYFGESTTFYDLACGPQGVKLACNNAGRARRRPDGPGRGQGARVNRVTLKLSNDILDGKVGGDEEYNMFLKLKGEARAEWLKEYAKSLGLL